MENFELFKQQMPLSEALLRAVIGIVVVISILAIIDVLIMVVSKIIQAIEKKTSEKKQYVAAKDIPAAQAVSVAPSVELIDVDEPTAAVIMAIVSAKSGIPLNRLQFKSIKLMEEKK